MGVVMSKGVPTKNTFTSEKTSWTRASFLKSSSTDDWIRSFLSSRFHCLDHSGTQLSRRVGDPNLRKFGARYARCIGSLGPTRVFFFDISQGSQTPAFSSAAILSWFQTRWVKMKLLHVVGFKKDLAISTWKKKHHYNICSHQANSYSKPTFQTICFFRGSQSFKGLKASTQTKKIQDGNSFTKTPMPVLCPCHQKWWRQHGPCGASAHRYHWSQ